MKEMDKYEYVIKLSKIISVNGKVNLDKLNSIVELAEEFYNTEPNKA